MKIFDFPHIKILIHNHTALVYKSADILFIKEHMFTFCLTSHIMLVSADKE